MRITEMKRGAAMMGERKEGETREKVGAAGYL